jgi:hypothetical protein
MSADNGIYILATPKGSTKEYRVCHLQGIDNLFYDYKGDYVSSQTPHGLEVIIKNAREMFKNTPIFETHDKALRHASKLAKDCIILEYGICDIEINKEF